MFFGTISLVIYTFVALVKASDYGGRDSSRESEAEVRVYRLKTSHPWEKFRDNQGTGMAETLEELIMAHDHERESLLPKVEHNFEEKIEVTPYYDVPQRDNCKENNGNCTQKCETVGYQTVCSCGEGYTLSSTTGCSKISGCDVVLSATSGYFTADKNNCQWTIIAPKGHIIEINLHTSGDYIWGSSFQECHAVIYDGNHTGASVIREISGDKHETVLRSSGQSMLIKTHHGCNQRDKKLHVSYLTGFPYLQSRYSSGSLFLRLPVSSIYSAETCLSLTYSGRLRYFSLSLNKNYHNHLQDLYSNLQFHHRGRKWTRMVFRIPFHEEATHVYFRFSKFDGNVYDLGRCLDLEYYAIGGNTSLGPGAMCRNGGTWSSTTQSCACPPGFTGVHCQEGCGPNRYGVNCSKTCSHLSSACERMIFCSKYSCSCATGFQGANCDSPCGMGYYGAGCKEKCGKCKNDTTCDRYTGLCYSGCSAGFYPPLCQHTYKVLVTVPDITAVTYNSLKIRTSFQNVAGEGEPILYEIQYKHEKQKNWLKLSPRRIANETEIEIMGLLPGKIYETRVILIDKNGGSYQDFVPETEARTKCIDPRQGNYTFDVKDVTESSVVVEWSYQHDETSLLCEIEDFELSILCGDGHFKFPITEKRGFKRLSDMMPDMKYIFQLVGKTVTGKKTLPNEIVVHTLPAPGRVRSVMAVPLLSGRQLNVTWLPPWNSQGKSLQYRVKYQCSYLLACEDISCNRSGAIEVTTTFAVLDDLQPHALYQIEITPLAEGRLVQGSYMLNATTAHAAPNVIPTAAANPVPALTNTSVSVSWKHPEDCTGLNGYMYGYSYELVDNNTEEIIRQGTVPENILSVNFSGLIPNHCYDTHIAAVTSGGDTMSELLIIPFCTTSNAPDRVQHLSIYKRGRRMVGLRWSPPLNTYGDIEYFTITYSTEGFNHNTTVITEPKYCRAWIDFYCYTVSGLLPGNKYHFEVRARNKEVNADGDATTVEAVTSEGASTAPVNLRIVNTTESSMLVEWGMPDNVNGQLRSFLIIVEQIDTKDYSGECCVEIPLKDYRVTSEEPFYQYQITGLSPASSYSVTVSAKTVTLGAEARVIGHTCPPKASLPQDALIVVKTESSNYTSDVVTLQLQPAERINGVKRTYILLCLTNDSRTQQSSPGNELATLLQSRFNENYHLISHYTQEQLENQTVVTFSFKDMGLSSTETKTQKYALVLIQDYMGNQSMDVFVTDKTGVETKV